MAARAGSIVVEGVEPVVDGGEVPARRTAGDWVRVEADLLKEGHDLLAGVVRYRQESPAAHATDWAEVPLAPLNNDRWEARFPLLRPGRVVFQVEAWADAYRTWASELKRKVDAGRNVESELKEGAALLEETSRRVAAVDADGARRLSEAAKTLLGLPQEAVAAALAPELVELAARHPDRSLATGSRRSYPIQVQRPLAEFGAWYEFFPRSAGAPGVHGTFRDAEKLLPEIAELGFDIVYLPPIHPIGRTHRKGKNNTLDAKPDDVGSPWAIGALEGGHKAVHPQLGSLDDFKKFCARAKEQGLEVAIDIAFQCSPDHPYLKEHPEWFNRRPDGTIKSAENPPKRYEDIVNFDFMGPAREALWTELRSVFRFWIDQGVHIFRVDNPHTKPIPFWSAVLQPLIEEFPDLIFLSEAFTRPKMMNALAKAGFTQSYTYFTWRNFKRELQDYLEEITRPPVSDFFLGNLWPNTPDILPELLQRGGPAAFKVRAALAASLSSSYGLYRGYEFCDGRAVPGTEEYLDSEKYQLRDWSAGGPGDIRDYLRALNRLRKEHTAFRHYRNLVFCASDNERVTAFSRRSEDGKSQILGAISLDPFEPQESAFKVPLTRFGLKSDDNYSVTELLSGKRSLWQGDNAYVKLTPDAPAAFWSVSPLRRSEAGFDYF